MRVSSSPIPRRLSALVALTAAGLLLAGCSGEVLGMGPLDPAGPIGRANREILINATVIMLFIVVPTILLAFWMAWHYRASNTKADYQPYWAFSGRIEAVVWAIPTLVILFLAGEIWIGSFKLDPFRPIESKQPPVEVQVVALDWKWLFIYPQEGVASVNELVIPAGRPVHFSITSASVMNVFFIPRLGSMIYAMPRMVSQLSLQADKPGAFFGQSAQFSGDGFSDMNFTAHSVTPEQFAAWAQAARGAGPALDHAAYLQLSQQSHDVKPYTYGAVQPGLFHDVATLVLPPGPGPTPGGPAHAGREVTPVQTSRASEE